MIQAAALDPSAAQGEAAAAFAVEALQGTPYHHQGRLPGPRGGVDCLGVPLLSWWHAGVHVRDEPVYSRQPSPAELERHLRDRCRPLVPGEERLGDILAMDVGVGIQHLAELVATPPHGEGLWIAHAMLRLRRVRVSPLQGELATWARSWWRPIVPEEVTG